MSTEAAAAAAPEHCPGVESESAGKSSACEGCPNQGACSSGSLRGAAGAEAELDLYEIARKLSSVKHILVVMSGKGGVGKSTVASQLARYIAHAAPEANVGLLDVDICGPSIPKAMGVEAEEIFTSASGWSPIFVEENLAVMSCGFLLTSPDDAVIWRGPKKNGIIKQFLRDVDWSGGSGDQGLDYLLIDTPPGTSDEHISLVSYLKHVAGLRGAILVTTPQEVAQADVRKQVDFCRRVKLPIIGVIENMAVFTCPKCHQDSFIFKRSADSGDKLLGDSKDVKLLGRIPLDPLIGKSVDEGVSLFDEQEEERKEGGGGGDLKTEAVRQKTSAKTIAAFKEVWANVQAAITESK